MATGYPDYLTWAGRSGAGESMTSISFSADVAAEGSSFADFPIVPAGYEMIIQNLTMSVGEDGFIHRVKILRISDDIIFFWINFITGGIFDFPGFSIAAGDAARIVIDNYGDEEFTFEGVVNYVMRAV